jgi:hypothetical protein
MTGTGPGDDFPAEDDDREDDSFGDDEDDWELAATFRPVPGGAACYFDPSQARMIRSLVGQVAELIGGEADWPAPGPGGEGPGGEGPSGTGPGGMGPEGATQAGGDEADELEKLLGLSGRSELPEDPVLARLLPDAYSDDPEAAAEFRRYTEESLRAAKIETAQMVLATLPPTGGEVLLNEAECQSWLRALNDVRLALGVRLGITDEEQDMAEDLPDDDPRAAYVMLYQWLAYLQDSLLDALT